MSHLRFLRQPPLLLLLLQVLLQLMAVTSFLVVAPRRQPHHPSSLLTKTALASSTKPNKQQRGQPQQQPKKKKAFTLKDLRDQIEQKPASFIPDHVAAGTDGGKKKSRYRRSRKRAENPQQQYVYARQRQQSKRGEADGSNDAAATTTTAATEPSLPITLARECGLTQPASQHCDAVVDSTREPIILGRIRVAPDTDTAGSYAYVIDKPAGWAILGGNSNNNNRQNVKAAAIVKNDASRTSKRQQQVTRLEIADVDGSRHVLEYSEADLLALMTPEEVEEYKADRMMMMLSADDAEGEEQSRGKATKNKVRVRMDDNNPEDEAFLSLLEDDDEKLIDDMDTELGEGDDSLESIEQEERELLSELTPDELEEYVREVGPLPDHFVRYQQQQRNPTNHDTAAENNDETANRTEQRDSDASAKQQQQQITRLEITDVDGSQDVLEYSEADLLAVMTPEETEEYEAEMTMTTTEMASLGGSKMTKKVQVRVDEEDEDEDEAFFFFEEGKQQALGGDMEMQELEKDSENTQSLDDYHDQHEVNSETAQVLSKIEARSKSASRSKTASFAPFSRPSVVAWLKECKANEGTPIKGGKYWTALAGATEVDDTGILVLCPKEHADNVFVDYLEYVAVIGNNNQLAPKPKTVASIPKSELTIDIVSTLKRGRRDDTVQTVKVMVPEKCSTCSSIIQACQQQFQDGIRGDPAGNPLGRLASRRLLHCNAVSVSSLVHDESVELETEQITDDIAILAERRNQHQYQDGSFLGRSELKRNPLTTAYREINGAADGFPGWTVDRYGAWLMVQHDDKMPRGPLPSIHDGNTAGVYYLPHNQDRSAMGSGSLSSSTNTDSTLTTTRPILLEGQPAPDVIDILENGVTYQVSLDKDLSTGIFLDQRPQRAWLARNCNSDTHVLNCFAHCGGFSVAAATAGASTTSIDLSKKWLDRVKPQLEANGVDFDERHDCIFGDCFDWLAKLAKRGEKYDIVILDPPSSSVGGKKKKRWSVKKDMPELVSLAAKVVKKGGLLFTTTNSASVSSLKFARLCRRGLEDAGLGSSAKLEKIQPMPHDFPSVGPQPVKNLVWRLN